MIRATAGAGLALLALTVAACPRPRDDSRPTTPDASVTTPVVTGTPKPASALDLVALDGCVLGHKGLLLDLGDPSVRALFGTRRSQDIESIEREGSTWARFRGRTATMQLPAQASDLEGGATLVEVRARGLAARSISAYVNGKAVGVLPLGRGRDAILSLRAAAPLLVAGSNELMFRFNGARTENEALAEIDWVHVGAGEPEPSYAAPTRQDVVTSVTLAGVAHQSLSLRAPGFVRCTGWLPRGAKLELASGLTRPGDADLEVRVLRDRASAPLVHRVHATSTGWTNSSLPLDDPAAPVGGTGTLGAVEVAVLRASKGVRVALGEPRVLPAPDVSEVMRPPPRRGVVLIVMGHLQPRTLAVYGGTLELPELAALAKGGMVYETHRASSTLANAAMAATLTGRSPRAMGVADGESRLPREVTTIADLARQAGIATAYFTANPMTGSTYGFDRGWGTVVEQTPSDELPAVAVLDAAGRWLEAHKAERFLVVIHARGGHPPWDVTTEELKDMAPVSYTGGIDPKHAAELLTRARHVPPLLRFTDADRARARALYERTLVAHDAALGRLLGVLRNAQREQDTLVAVTGDVSVNDAAHVPFGDGEPPDEALLITPLIIRDGAGMYAGRRVQLPTSDVDVARTLVQAMGLVPSTLFGGVDLYEATAGNPLPQGRALLAATRGFSSLRWGNWVWSGTERRTALCDLALEPACLTDVRATSPLAADALTRRAFDLLEADREQAAKITRDPATPDTSAAAALKAWGR